ncbi:MAG: hypothetical protein AAGM40_17645, partial [Cyanobacteria bacterium J06573_2]
TPQPRPVTPRPPITPQPRPVTPRPPITPQPRPVTPRPPAPPIREIPPPSRKAKFLPNYIGIGGNFGLDGDTALGENSFTVFSRIGLTNNFSFRPSAMIGDEAAILVPLTIEFPIKSSAVFRKSPIIAVPYIGAGAMFSTDDDNSVKFLVTGGVDIPITPKFTGTAGVNVGISDETDVGIKLGIGYSF